MRGTGFLKVENGGVDISKDYTSLVFHYSPLVLISAGLLLLGALVPLVGLLFCCCRCVGRCGARSQQYDKKYDKCRRHFLAFLLSSVTVLFMFGVVCAFVTNEYMEEGSKNIPKAVWAATKDSKLYLNNTKKEISTLLVTNFGELDVVLNRLLKRSGEIVKDKLGEISKAAVLTNLTSIVHGLNVIRNDLMSIDSLTKSLQINARNLEIALRNVREMLLKRLRMCQNERACIEFLNKYNITALTLESNFTQLLDRYLPQLPDVTISLENVTSLIARDIEDEVIKGKDEFDRIKLNIQQSVDKTIPDIAREISKAGNILKGNSDKVIKILDKVESYIDNIPYKTVDEKESQLLEYAQYRYYMGLGVCLVLIVVLFCLSAGLLCGYCGRRPDAHFSDDCCDKGTASRFLMMSVWITFLTFSAMVAVVLGYMLTGSFADRAVCTPLRNPTTDSTFALVDRAVNFTEIYASIGEDASKLRPLNLSTIISECHQNTSIYHLLGLESGSMLEYTQKFNLPEKVRQLSDSIILSSDIVIITPLAEQQLRALAASPLNTIDLTVYTAVLNDRITSIDLLQLAAALNHTASRLPPRQQDVKALLQTEAMYLEVHQERQVDVMVKLSKQLHSNATLLQNHLRFNHSSLKQAVDSLLRDLKQAQKTLNSQGPAIVRKLAEEFGKEFGLHIDSYLARVDEVAKKNVGRCWPVSLIYNATVVTLCNNILDPYNGFWLSVGCAVLLFIPAIILSVKLSTLYQKAEPYPGALVEAEYLYDAYAERDSVPLQNSSGAVSVGAKKKKKPKKKKTSNSNAGYHLGRGGDPRVAQQPPAPAQTDERGVQWESYQSNAPPRYPAISSEYERPPPYYFPGPNQQTAS
ncbi:Prominin [Nesidiocoris tenuis]|uniref:Prominin n=1 Tax=Nesidiocoris tenuis TaxID=355587 RepID=A0ABN7BC95_9HEMI|nr:Prominin [Nesidiocoris tenuis]